MNQVDSLYRAFIDYTKTVESSRECLSQKNAIMSANADSDLIEVISTSCNIDEDWIEAIEVGLVCIERAINESRQFIRSDGSVLPIERVKQISKESVAHLSRRSDLITSLPRDGEDVIPDELYISERLSDFAVYENKFLCMLLNRLKSFVSIRYNKIIELTNEYNGSISLNKTIASNKRKIVYELKMNELRRDDCYLKERGRAAPLINRIEDILKVITHLLNTPLMQEVLKTPPLKPPIIKTNVLKMNRNFKGATLIYDFISAYDKDGYVVKKSFERLAPFSELIASEIAQTIMLTSFLVYKHGLKLDTILKKTYLIDEEKRRLLEKEKRSNELLRLKRRVEESGGDVYEYMHLLQTHNKALERDSIELDVVKNKLEAQNEKNQELKKEIELLNSSIRGLNSKIEEDNLKFEAQTARLNEEHLAQIDKINEAFAAKENELKKMYENQIEGLRQVHINELKAKNAEYDELKGHLAAYDEKIEGLERGFKQKENENKKMLQMAIDEGNARAGQCLLKCNEESEKRQEIEGQKILLEAKYLALRKELGLIKNDENFSKKETFEELEMQYNAFKTFFKEEWKKTKRTIRKEVLKRNDKEDKADG